MSPPGIGGRTPLRADGGTGDRNANQPRHGRAAKIAATTAPSNTPTTV